MGLAIRKVVFFRDVELIYNELLEESMKGFYNLSKYNSEILVGKDEVDTIEIKLVKNKKKIVLSISSDVTVRGQDFVGLSFCIRTKLPCEREWFSLKDYCTHYNYEHLAIENDFFLNESTESSIEKITAYLTRVIELLRTEPLNEILFTDKWVDIPADMSPYK